MDAAYKGPISPTFVYQTKICQRTAFGENFCHPISPKQIYQIYGLKICQICAPFAKRLLPQKSIEFLEQNICW